MRGSGSSSIQVLLVDDETDFAQLVADQLSRTGGDLDVAVETDPRGAVDRLREGSFDCVVSDYEMPGMDGLALLETVRERHPELPFILFTGRGSEAIASEAISAGVTEYMQKGTDPEQFEVLANRVRNAVEKYETERELERTETRYRRLVEQNFTGICIIQGKSIEYANPKCAEIFDYEPDKFLQVTAYDIVAAADHDALDRVVRRAETGALEETELTLRGLRSTGEQFQFEVHCGRIDYRGEPAVLASLVDVTERRRRERELEEYRELVETVGDPMYVLDEAGYVRKANAAMAQLLDVDRDELLGAHLSTLLAEDDYEAVERMLDEFAAGERDPPETLELDLSADGDPVPCEANVTTLADEEGAYRGSVGVVRVIAERKARERELQQYETIVETAPDGVFIVDADGYIVSGNDTGAALLGREREDVIGAHYEEFVDAGVLDRSFIEDYVDTVEELLEAGAEDGKAKLETTIDHPDGVERIVEFHLSPLVDGDGFRGTVGIIRDVTERKNIERALRAERDRLSALFENIPEPAVDYEFHDGRPVVLQVNDAFEETFGYSEAELVGETLADHIVPAEEYRLGADEAEEIRRGEPVDLELERQTADGEIRSFLLRNAPIPTEDDTVQGYAIYTDITERKETEDRVNALFEFSTDCIVETESVDGTPLVTRVNDAFVETFGYDEDDIVGEPLDEYIVPDDRRDEVVDVNQRVHEGEPVELEVTRETADGERDFLLRAIPFDVYEGDWTYAVYTDITERKERERRLSALHEATRELMEATSEQEVTDIAVEAAEGVLGLGVAGVYAPTDDGTALTPVAATAGADEMFGPLPDIGAGDAVAWSVYEEGTAVITDDVRTHDDVYDPDTPARSEMLLPLGEQGVFMAASREVGAFDETDRTLAKVLTSNLEAALDRAERESVLRERERRLSALHEATRGLMEAADRETVVDIGLEAAESVLGLEAAAFYGTGDGRTRLEPLATTDRAEELFGGVPPVEEGEGVAWAAFESGDPVLTDDVREEEVLFEPESTVRSQMVLPIGDHGVFTAASTAVGAFDDADTSLAKVLVSNVEAALDRAERESLLRKREEDLLRQNERLEEFAGVVSHDLRSPLTVAKGNAYLLRENGEEEHLEKIEDALERMERLIDDLLTLAQQGETVDEPERVAVDDVSTDAWRNVDTAGADLTVRELPEVEADPGRLQQLLENLFRNAVEHGGDDVAVEVGPTGDGFYVADDGEGIPDEEREKLFEAGFSTAEGGTGFGLSIVKQIAEAHGWEVNCVESDAGGARFEFTGATPRGWTAVN
jgi:PAS domain S-box-containing protein